MKKGKIFFACLLIGALFIGCANSSDAFEKEQETVLTEFEEVAIGEIIEEEVCEQVMYVANERNISKSGQVMDILYSSKLNQITDFVDTLYDESNKNVLYSPLALDMTLGMAEIGALENTKNSMNAYLMQNDYSLFAQNYIQNNLYDIDWDSNFEELKYNSVFNLSNAVWLNNKIDWKTVYTYKLNKYFNADVYSVDFDSNELPETINSFISNTTNNINDEYLLKENIEQSSILLNTIYFEDAWKYDWVEIEDMEFITEESKKVDSIMMISALESYYENDNAVAFSSEYKNGFKFIGILPKQEGEFKVSDLDILSLLKSESKDYKLEVKMPVFKVDFVGDNFNLLKDKYPSIFLGTNYEEMTDEDIELNSFLQAYSINFNEFGTNTEAITSILATDNIVTPEQTKSIDFNRPFAYMILDNNNNIVFIGKITSIE